MGEDWKQASCSVHRKRIGERLSRECQLELGILLQDVDLDIKRDLQELLERPDNKLKDSYNRWNLLWNGASGDRMGTIDPLRRPEPKRETTNARWKQDDQGRLATILVQVQRNRIGFGADRDEGRRRKRGPRPVAAT